MVRSLVNACRRHARNEPVVKRGPASENHRIDETKHPDPGGRPGGGARRARLGHDDCAQSWRRLLASLQDAVKVKRGCGLGSGGFRALRDLHHRLISLEPPARGKRGAMRPVLAPCTLHLAPWNLELGTWNLEPPWSLAPGHWAFIPRCTEACVCWFAKAGRRGLRGWSRAESHEYFVRPRAGRESSSGLQPVQAGFANEGWKGLPGGHELKLMTTLVRPSARVVGVHVAAFEAAAVAGVVTAGVGGGVAGAAADAVAQAVVVTLLIIGVVVLRRRAA